MSDYGTVRTSLRPKWSEVLRNTLLLGITFITTSMAGMMWLGEFELNNISRGFPYAFSILFILACHEFGHYFACRKYGISASLPYFIPFPPLAELVSFGTMGAVIRTRTPIPSRKALFDVGISGPIAGYIASMLVLAWGFSHLPGREFLLSIHPEYSFAIDNIPNLPPGSTLTMGSNIAYDMMGFLFSTPGAYVPPMHEMYHYPFLVTGWFGMFVTALNLIPAGQLDGGHVSYALLGHRHGIIARIMVVLLASVGIMAVVPIILDLLGNSQIAEYLVQMIDPYGAYFWPGWLLWALLIVVVIKIDHPPVLDETPPGRTRQWLGVFAIIMFVTSLSPSPIFLK